MSVRQVFDDAFQTFNQQLWMGGKCLWTYLSLTLVDSVYVDLGKLEDFEDVFLQVSPNIGLHHIFIGFTGDWFIRSDRLSSDFSDPGANNIQFISANGVLDEETFKQAGNLLALVTDYLLHHNIQWVHGERI